MTTKLKLKRIVPAGSEAEEYIRWAAENAEKPEVQEVAADFLEENGKPEQARRLRLRGRQAGESWCRAWRQGFARQLPSDGLRALLKALLEDDPRLIQGATTTPPALHCVATWPVEASDPIAFCTWQGKDGVTVEEAESGFARACFECDQLLGEPAVCRHVLNWLDDTPRSEMLERLAAEVELELQKRHYGVSSQKLNVLTRT